MRRCIAVVLSIMTIFFVTSCGKKEVVAETKEKIEYEICDDTKLPDDVLKIIHEKEEEKFNFSYTNNEYTYIVVGYGMHDTDNYITQLEDIFTTSKNCYVKCRLVTKDYLEDEESDFKDCSEPSVNPHLVIRCKHLDIPVVYNI